MSMNEEINSTQLGYLDKITDDLNSDSDYNEIYEAVFQVGGSDQDCHIIAIHLGREPNE